MHVQALYLWQNHKLKKFYLITISALAGANFHVIYHMCVTLVRSETRNINVIRHSH